MKLDEVVVVALFLFGLGAFLFVVGYDIYGTPGHNEGVQLGLMAVTALGTSGTAIACLLTMRGLRKQGKKPYRDQAVVLFCIFLLLAACALSFVIWIFVEDARARTCIGQSTANAPQCRIR